MFTNVCTTVLMFHNEADFHNPNKFINAVGLFLSYFNDVSQQPEWKKHISNNRYHCDARYI